MEKLDNACVVVEEIDVIKGVFMDGIYA